MKVIYQQAVVNLCLDLTNPDATASPVAVLLVGKADGWPVAAFACHIAEQGDPLTKEIVGDIPQLLVRHLNSAFTPQTDIGSVLSKLHESLRNSLYVAEILPTSEMDVEAEDVEEAFPRVMRVVTDTIRHVQGLPVRVPRRRPGFWDLFRPKHAAPRPHETRPARAAMSIWNPPAAAAPV